MKNRVKKQRKRAIRRAQARNNARYAVDASPPNESAKSSRFLKLQVLLGFIRNSGLLRSASTLTLFPQRPKVDISVYAQHRGLSKIWQEVGGYVWTSFHEETSRSSHTNK